MGGLEQKEKCKLVTVLARHDQPHGILSRVAWLVVLYSGFCEILAFLIGAKAGEDFFSAELGIFGTPEHD